MALILYLNLWLDTLAALVIAIADEIRRRHTLVVSEVGVTFVVRSTATTALSHAAPVVVLEPGDRAPERIQRLARRRLVTLEYPSSRVVTRHLSVPVQAREFLSGVVRNQIDRLSPWPSDFVLYNYHVVGGDGAAQPMLDVEVLIAERVEVEKSRARIAEAGLAVDCVAAALSGSSPVSLWSGKSAIQSVPGRMRLAVGGTLAAIVAVCAAISAWALVSTSEIEAESSQRADRARVLQKVITGQVSPQSLAALPLPRRAWIAKEKSLPIAVLLESLSSAIPDGSYIRDLQFEDGKLHLGGFADDAPPLIAALERSGYLSDVHFSAPTTRGQDGAVRFSVEAKVVTGIDAKERRP
jgi:general secretion pathway protein L